MAAGLGLIYEETEGITKWASLGYAERIRLPDGAGVPTLHGSSPECVLSSEGGVYCMRELYNFSSAFFETVFWPIIPPES